MFDKRLKALAACPVIEDDLLKGGMLFNPHPIITAGSNNILSHEVCHVLAGADDYNIFNTAVRARPGNPDFKYILNLLYDWYHEYYFGKYSMVLWNTLTELHVNNTIIAIDYPEPLQEIVMWYTNRNIDPSTKGIRDVVDLVIMADHLTEAIQPMNLILEILMEDIAGGFDIGKGSEKSDYYIKAVAKYWNIIDSLASLWKRNKYAWTNNYYGEINWKDLCGLFIGDMLKNPVFRLFSKRIIDRTVYMVIDKSGSTGEIKNVIMDSAIIITESLRISGVPISILDVGGINDIVNKIDEPLDFGWFTPLAYDGTPLGEICSLITDADPNSYLLIITDGQPNNWDKLIGALHAFPGDHLTFVIGNSYGLYQQRIGNAVSIEPHTIIRELLHDQTLT